MTLPGTTVTSRESPSSRLEPVKVGTAFVVGFADRGPVDAPVLIRNLSQYVRTFGAFVSYGALYDWLDVAFREGLTEAYVGRVVGPAAATATIPLVNAGAENTLTIKALSPGGWGNNLKVVVAAGVEGGKFIITVKESEVVKEVSPELADTTAAVAWAAKSSYIRLSDVGGKGDPKAQTVALAGGKDDRENATEESWKNGMNLFEADLGPGQIAAPGRTTEAAQKNLLSHAELRDRIALCDATDTATVATLVSQAAALRALTTARYGGLFGPWGVFPGTAPGTTRTVPWTAVVAGNIARLASLGESPNVAAAGDLGASAYAVDLSQAAWGDEDRETLNDSGVNVARLQRGAFRTYGFRTLVDGNLDDSWLQLTNARLNMFIASEGSAIGDRFVFAEIDGRRHKISEFAGALTAMLIPLYEAGSLYGETPEEAFIVDTGPQVNTPESIANRELKAVISVRMSPFAEMVQIEISKVATTEVL